MFHSLPAILIGGPPHTGKSVLTYSLTQALRKRYIDHYVIRACPDGEGDWSQEIDREGVRLLRIKGQWKPEFVRNVCYALDHRHFPLLVDMGGKPIDWQMGIIHRCTHSLLLLRPDDETSTSFWKHLVRDYNLFPVACIHSVLDGPSRIVSQGSVLEGTLSGLDRHSLAQGPLFDLLVERIDTLFTEYASEELRQEYFKRAPAKVINLDVFLQMFAPESRWEPWMVQRLLSTFPLQVPLAVYGRGTNWLYGALVEHSFPQPFYQFDPRLGWVRPPQLTIGFATAQEVVIDIIEYIDVTVLSVRLLNDYLDYTEASLLVFPPLAKEQGVILTGKLPLWLVTALVHLYNTDMGISWVACYSPQLENAVVVASHVVNHTPGDLVHFPLYQGGDIEGV